MPEILVGRSLFEAINNNDLSKFKQLLQTNPNPNLLLLTDNCDDKLKNILGGEWSAYSGQFGRYENNTLLNFAASMERIDFVLELIDLHSKYKQIQIYKEANDASFSPLNMLLMIHGEFLQKYNDRGELVTLKIYSEEEKVGVLEKTLKAVNTLLPYYTRGEILGMLGQEVRLLALPEVVVALLKSYIEKSRIEAEESKSQTNLFSPQSLSSATQANKIQLESSVIINYLQHLLLPHALLATKNLISERVEFFNSISDDEYKEITAGSSNRAFNRLQDMESDKNLVNDYEQLLIHSTSTFKKIEKFIGLLQADDELKKLLDTAMMQDMPPTKEDRRNRLRGIALPKNPPFIFTLFEAFSSSSDEEDRKKIYTILQLLITKEVAKLKDEKGVTVGEKFENIPQVYTLEKERANRLGKSSLSG